MTLLTGRENIYLNGAILGMRKVEIDRKFDEIVAFAEIEKFIDMPVKGWPGACPLQRHVRAPGLRRGHSPLDWWFGRLTMYSSRRRLELESLLVDVEQHVAS